MSVIGARRATPYGMAIAEMAGRCAADNNIVVVSGGALGCDYRAGMASLNAGGKTVVVAGCGADVDPIQLPPQSFLKQREKEGEQSFL